MRRICWLEQEKTNSLLSCFIKYRYKYEYSENTNTLYRVNGSRKVHLPTELLYFTKLVQSLPAKSIKVAQEACTRSFIRKSSIISKRKAKTSNDNYDHLKLGNTSREKNVFYRAMPEWKHFFSFMTKQSSKSLILIRGNVISVFVIGHGRVN